MFTNKILQLASEQFGITNPKLSDRFAIELTADSLDIIEFTMEIENDLNLYIEETVIDKVKTIEDMLNVVYEIINYGESVFGRDLLPSQIVVGYRYE